MRLRFKARLSIMALGPAQQYRKNTYGGKVPLPGRIDPGGGPVCPDPHPAVTVDVSYLVL